MFLCDWEGPFQHRQSLLVLSNFNIKNADVIIAGAGLYTINPECFLSHW